MSDAYPSVKGVIEIPASVKEKLTLMQLETLQRFANEHHEGRHLIARVEHYMASGSTMEEAHAKAAAEAQPPVK